MAIPKSPIGLSATQIEVMRQMQEAQRAQIQQNMGIAAQQAAQQAHSHGSSALYGPHSHGGAVGRLSGVGHSYNQQTRYSVQKSSVDSHFKVIDNVLNRVVNVTYDEVRHFAGSRRADPEAIAYELGIRRLNEPVPVEAHVAVVRELEDIKRRFESLFKVPADAIGNAKVEQSPTSPGQWKIRVRVEAYEIETTIGEMSAAKANPASAYTWWSKLRASVPGGESHENILRNALMKVEQEIAIRTITTGVASDAQPITDSEKKEESDVSASSEP